MHPLAAWRSPGLFDRCVLVCGYFTAAYAGVLSALALLF
jgi:hypothetical protein